MRFKAMSNRLERSDILFQFLATMRSAPILLLPLRPVQPLLVRAAVHLTLVGCRRLWVYRPWLECLGGWGGAANRSLRGSPCS